MNNKILVVEDDYANQQVAILFLKKFGYQTKLAENGKIAVELAQQEKFSLILMDCQMPIMSGFEASLSIRNNSGLNQATPIIALTANMVSGIGAQCKEYGMDDILNKPVKMDDMKNMVEHWYGEKSSTLTKLD